jgi:hypothetical protein
VASEALTIRFPSGAWEYTTTDRVPDVGDTLERDGETWFVAGVTESVDDHRVITMALRPEAEKEPPRLKSPAPPNPPRVHKFPFRAGPRSPARASRGK